MSLAPSRGSPQWLQPILPAQGPQGSPGSLAGVHTVAGQCRTLTCFPNIQHEM